MPASALQGILVGMSSVFRAFVFLCALGGFFNTHAAKQTNFIFFLVDDMGWADIGANGSKFHETPNIDRRDANKDAKLTLEELKKTK